MQAIHDIMPLVKLTRFCNNASMLSAKSPKEFIGVCDFSDDILLIQTEFNTKFCKIEKKAE